MYETVGPGSAQRHSVPQRVRDTERIAPRTNSRLAISAGLWR